MWWLVYLILKAVGYALLGLYLAAYFVALVCWVAIITVLRSVAGVFQYHRTAEQVRTPDRVDAPVVAGPGLDEDLTPALSAYLVDHRSSFAYHGAVYRTMHGMCPDC